MYVVIFVNGILVIVPPVYVEYVDLCMIIHTGCDRPALKLLNKHVRKEVSTKWHDLGLELLEQEDEAKVNEIETNNPSDVSKCCKEMFQLWLEKCTNATWNQLIQALREVDLNNLATTIEGMLKPSDKIVCASAGTCVIIVNTRMIV